VTGVASAFCFAFLNVYTRRVLGRYTLWTTVFYSLVFASAMWMIIQPPWTLVSEPVDGKTWGVLVLFAVLSILIPHTLYFSGLRFVVPSRAIIVSTLEPIVAIVSAALLLGEYLQQLQVVGATVVIGAIVVLQMRPEARPGNSGGAIATERGDAT
jgi:drug/metabolite transporter (DMT)-like permease